eukprot:745754-Hanusia_phi.AAC.2
MDDWLYCYDLAMQEWKILSKTQANSPSPRTQPIMTVHNSKVFVYGGIQVLYSNFTIYTVLTPKRSPGPSGSESTIAKTKFPLLTTANLKVRGRTIAGAARRYEKEAAVMAPCPASWPPAGQTSFITDLGYAKVGSDLQAVLGTSLQTRISANKLEETTGVHGIQVQDSWALLLPLPPREDLGVQTSLVAPPHREGQGGEEHLSSSSCCSENARQSAERREGERGRRRRTYRVLQHLDHQLVIDNFAGQV